MKKTALLIFVFAVLPFFFFAQCNVFVSSTNTNCFGSTDGTAFVTANGVPPFGYLWMPGNLTGASQYYLGAGTYTVTMTDGVGCIATATVTISSPPPLSATISSVAPSCGPCCDGSASVSTTGGTAPFNYQWMPGNQTTPSINNLCAGTYSVCVTDAAGCSTCNPTNCSICQTSVTLSAATAIPNDPLAYGSLSIYPSPTTQNITLDVTFANMASAEISVCNLLGEIVFAKTSEPQKYLHETINVTGLPNGIYFLGVKTAFGNSIQRFVKQ